MAIDLVKEYFDKFNIKDKVLEFDVSSATAVSYTHLLIYTDPMPKECIDVLSKNGLKLLGCARATPNNIDWKAAKDNNIPIIHAPGRNAHTVAEYTVGMLLAICKRIGFSYHGLMDGRFLADEKDIYDVPERKDVIWRFKDRENPRSSYPWSIDVYDRTIGPVSYTHLDVYKRQVY